MEEYKQLDENLWIPLCASRFPPLGRVSYNLKGYAAHFNVSDTLCKYVPAIPCYSSQVKVFADPNTDEVFARLTIFEILAASVPPPRVQSQSHHISVFNKFFGTFESQRAVSSTCLLKDMRSYIRLRRCYEKNMKTQDVLRC